MEQVYDAHLYFANWRVGLRDLFHPRLVHHPAYRTRRRRPASPLSGLALRAHPLGVGGGRRRGRVHLHRRAARTRRSCPTHRPAAGLGRLPSRRPASAHRGCPRQRCRPFPGNRQGRARRLDPRPAATREGRPAAGRRPGHRPQPGPTLLARHRAASRGTAGPSTAARRRSAAELLDAAHEVRSEHTRTAPCRAAPARVEISESPSRGKKFFDINGACLSPLRWPLSRLRGYRPLPRFSSIAICAR